MNDHRFTEISMLRPVVVLILVSSLGSQLRAQVWLRKPMTSRPATEFRPLYLDSSSGSRQHIVHDAAVGAVGGAVVGVIVGLLVVGPSHPCRPNAVTVCGQGSSRASVVLVFGLEGSAAGALLGSAVGWTRSSRDKLFTYFTHDR